jgi:hypothetical protein
VPPQADCAESGGVFSRRAAAVALLLYCCLTAAYYCLLLLYYMQTVHRLAGSSLGVLLRLLCGLLPSSSRGGCHARGGGSTVERLDCCKVRYCFTAALLLLYCCFTVVLLLLYYCFTFWIGARSVAPRMGLSDAAAAGAYIMCV